MATVYLSPSGNDSRTYAQAQNSATPWATLAKVQSSATSGDTVSMAAGTFNAETVTFTKSFTFIGAALSGGLPTTLINYGSSEYIHLLNSTNGTLSYQRIKFYDFDQTTLSNFKFDGGVANATISFVNCVFDGIVYGSFADSLVSSTSAGSGNAVNFTSCLLDDVRSHTQTSGWGGLVVGNHALTITVTGCTFSFRETGATRYLPVLWYGNTVTHTVTMKNTIIKCESGTAVLWESGYGGGGASETVSYSCLYNLSGSVPTGTGVITSDPLFINPATGDFHLAQTSPARGLGTYL